MTGTTIAEIICRAEPHLATVEIPSLGDSPPVRATGVVTSPHSVALGTGCIAGRRLEEVAEARIRIGDRRWRACLNGLVSEWDACCFGPIEGELPAAPVPVPIRWSHTLRANERIFGVAPLPGGRLQAVPGSLLTLEPFDSNAAYERSRLGIARFDGPIAAGAIVFDSEARCSGVLATTLDTEGRIGVVVPAERLSGLPEVPFCRMLSRTGSHAQLLRKITSGATRDPRVLAMGAIAARQLCDLSLALKILDLILRLDAEHPWAHFERAVVLQELGRTGESALALERAAALDPERYGWRSIGAAQPEG